MPEVHELTTEPRGWPRLNSHQLSKPEVREMLMDLEAPARIRRKQLWDINTGWHCSIIGTCLALSDLRVIARKLGYKITDPERCDLQLHSSFTQNGTEKNRASKLLNKLLNRKHEAAIKRFRGAETSEDIMEIWRGCYAAGNIPGPFWAAMSHPRLDQETGVKIYGDVHMLSHLVGASNRADLASLNSLQKESASAKERSVRDNCRYQDKFSEKGEQISALQDQVASLSAALEKERSAANVRRASLPSQSENHEREVREVADLRQALALTKLERDKLTEANERLHEMVPCLESELESLEQAVSKYSNGNITVKNKINLGGRCLLYVGGRTTQVCRLRKLVACWNGHLIHHDGGLEKSLKELTRSVAKADAVLFPTDCISHNAALRVKNLCRQSMKPFVPLRTSGVGSFVAGVQLSLGTRAPGEK